MKIQVQQVDDTSQISRIERIAKSNKEIIMDLKVTPFIGDTPPTEEEIRADLEEEQQLRVYRWSNGPDEEYTSHTHGYHKIIFVLEGSIQFDLPTRQEKLNLKVGDRLDLPSGIRHSAVVGDEGVTCLEAHIY
jgi:quercetin dioxygenase-like cupin family protein